MSSFYIDNFRGFQDTVIHLKRANFFVGENSTGKTSVLSLLALINTFDFWYRFGFNSEFVELGTFSDIASDEKPSFCIGAVRGWVDFQNSHQRPSWVRVRFKNVDDVPTVCELALVGEEAGMYIQYEHAHLAYAIIEEKRSRQTFGDEKQFERWVRAPFPTELEKIDISKIEGSQRTAFYFTHLVELAAREKRKELSYRLPALFNPTNDAFCWIAPIRAKPKRTYDSYRTTYSPEGDHIPYILNSVLASDDNKASREALRTKLEHFGKLSELFQKVKPVRFGRRKTSPFEITVRIGGQSRRISSVGYGISQVLPIVVQTSIPSANTLYLVQQPEVHLHPRAQAALGNLFFEFVSKHQQLVALETHSDFLIDRFRILIAGASKTDPELAQVLFFERCKEGNKVTPISIDDHGRYSEGQPKSFRDFFIREQMDLLGL